MTYQLDDRKIVSLYGSGKSIKHIAGQLGVSHGPVKKRLLDAGIILRGPEKASFNVALANETYRNREWLKYHYCDLQETQEHIAGLCKTTKTVICDWMNRLDIHARSIDDNRLIAAKSFDLSGNALNYLNGLLLGDGCVLPSLLSSVYTHVDKHYDYIEYLFMKLAGFGMAWNEKIYKRKHIFNNKECYTYSAKTYSYLELKGMRDLWYPEGKKTVPPDIKLTSDTCRCWYVGDGTLAHPRKNKLCIGLATNGFPKGDVHMLINKLSEIGIVATYQPSMNSVRINHANTLKFLDYIGPCPQEIWSIYGYKWDVMRNKREWEAEFLNA